MEELVWKFGKGLAKEPVLLTDHETSYSQSRPTLAFFSSTPGGTFSYEKWQMWRGIADAARENSVNLIYVAGGEFEFDPGRVLYQLIGPYNANGLVFWNDFISSRSTTGKMREFVEQYYPLPMPHNLRQYHLDILCPIG